MTERVNTPFTNEHFAAWCLSMIGQPYWYGTCVYKCTESLRKRKAEQYPSHYKDNRTARYRDDIEQKKIAADCVGGCKGYAWTSGGIGVVEAIGTDSTYSSKYGGGNCPDKSANGMFTYAKSKGMDYGSVETLPEVVGLALHKDGHVGYYVGDGCAVEWKGFSDGCVKTAVKGRGWTSWYRLPFIDYGDSETVGMAPSVSTVLGDRTLKKGMKGSDVKAMQELLLQLGYELPKHGADGDFGSETLAALLKFQKDAELEQDGLYGDLTHQALMGATADDDEGRKEETSEPEITEPEQEQAEAGTVVIVSEGGKVNIRQGNGTNYGRISSVAPGTTLAHVATAANGWHAVIIGAKVGWVSGDFSRII